MDKYFGGWIKVIDKNELNRILNILNIEYKKRIICPSQNSVFKAFKYCNYNDLKIVMIGQDPYPQKGIATGLLFGNNKEIDNNSLSPSLQIIKEASINYEIPHNSIIFDNTLESWANQGILMLNSALTVELNNIGSHTMLWRPFISKLLVNLSKYNPGIIYVLFGKQAQTFKPYINKNFNIILEESHPAYYARVGTKMPSAIFEEINKLVKERYNTYISWYSEY